MADPTSISGLLCWVKAGVGLFKDGAGTQPVSADGDSIALWKDQSGNGNDLTQSTAGNQPKWDATLQCVHSEYNANEWMNLAAGLSYGTQSVSLAFIGSLVSLRDANASGSNQVNHVFLNGTTNKGNFYYDRQSGGSVGVYYATYDGTSIQSPAQSFRPMHTSPVLIVFSSGSGGTIIYTNSLASATLAAMASATITSGAIFGNLAGSNFPLQARIFDAALYNRAVTSGDVSTLLNYAATRGVQTGFNGNVIFDGDSETAGSGNTLNRNWVQQMGLPPGIRQVNVAESGIQLATLASEASAFVDPYYVSGIPNVLVIFAGTNDFAIGSATVATVYGNLQSYCTARKATNPSLKIVVITMLPRNVGGTMSQANWQAYHDDIVNGFAGSTLACDAVVDTSTDSRIGPWGANTNTTYYAADAIHLNNTGAAILAAMVRPKVTKFLPVGSAAGMQLLNFALD